MTQPASSAVEGGRPGNRVSCIARAALADLPRPAGKRVALFDGRSLAGWEPWLGYADPAATYRPNPGAEPIGTSRDFAVKRIDG